MKTPVEILLAPYRLTQVSDLPIRIQYRARRSISHEMTP